MLSTSEAITAISSTILRLSAYGFLRCIPGHHYPPVVIASLVVYLSCIFAYPQDLEKPYTLADVAPDLADGAKSIVGKDGAHSSLEKEDMEQNIAIDDKSTRLSLKVLLSGIPNWNLKAESYATIAINIALALLTLDLIFRGIILHPSDDLRFSRVGYVDVTSAKVLFREPDPTQLPVYAYYRPTGGSRSGWTTADRIYYLTEETDYTYPITFSSLWPATQYEYSLSNNISGTFTTAPDPSSPAAGKLTFLTSSCIKPNFPYNPFAHSLSIHGFTHLSHIATSYVDVPLRLSSSYAPYRSEYRRIYASPSWSLPGLSSLPWLHTLDDHEIADDWSSGNTTEPFPAAQDPFIHYQVSVNPPTPKNARTGQNTTYFTFTRGPASFFMLDTRAYRTKPEPSSEATILGPQQLSSLLSYLRHPEPDGVHWKFIASSVPFTKNWRVGTPDTWGGFLAERATVLSAMHYAQSHLGVRVIVLSGDRHEFAAIRFPPSTKSLDVTANPQSGPHEFSVGPLSMFYLPFRTFRQIDDEDVAIKYLPDGNSKIGLVDVQNLEGASAQRSLLKYTLYIDGQVAWEYTLTSPAPEFRGFRGGPLDAVWG